jgi:LytS/YehU family sensor histidine kinase
LLAAEILNIPTSPFKFVDDFDAFNKAVKELGYPCIVKPVMSSSGKGQVLIESENDIEKASDYITKFSRLIREILKNSSSLSISLEEDLGILGLYVKLEQMRMVGGFDYVVTIDDNIDLKEIKVPPLFMQPYVENAIWHGFSNNDGYKKINLSIYNEDDKIRCEIVDNGIGIDQSKYRNKNKGSSRKPFGLKVSEDRIKMLYENQNVYVILEDISDQYGTGTKVTLKFPKVM